MNIFIFHRDFRVQDNLALSKLIEDNDGQDIYLFFIFTQEQIEDNKYFAHNSFQYMIHTLLRLTKEVHINILKSQNEWSAIEKLIDEGHNIKMLYTNKDYTDYAVFRSNKMKKMAKKHNFVYKEFNDNTLLPPESEHLRTLNKSYFKIFTPFWKKHLKMFNSKWLKEYNVPPFKSLKIKSSMDYYLDDSLSNNFGLPQSKEDCASAILGLNSDYAINRDYLWMEHNTSQISAALKFGIISIRFAHLISLAKFKCFDNAFSRQLMWRDFAYYSAVHARINSGWKMGDDLTHKYKIDWDNNLTWFEKWKKGETGFFVVDAGMRELSTTGKMQNRARMICASFLVKNLQIDWRWGEKYFAQYLIDYDPLVNQLSWQWVAGTGLDAQPYFRIFNPDIQLLKFDKDHIYASRFLKDVDFNRVKIIDYKQSVKKTLSIYTKI